MCLRPSGTTQTIGHLHYRPTQGFSEQFTEGATFAALISARGLGAPSGRVSLPSSLEQQVDEGLRSLQGALLLWVLHFVLLLFLLLDFCDNTSRCSVIASFLIKRFVCSACLTCHSHLALRAADRSARPAESQQHSCLWRLFPSPLLLCTNHCVFQQGGSSQTASGVCARPLRSQVCLDGGLSSLRL